jgi:hypothetical protein
VSELPAGVGHCEDKPNQPKFFHSGIKLGRLNSLGLLLALIFSLRIADGFGQHLAQLSLGLRRFPLGWLPLCHVENVGMPEVELNPRSSRINAAFCHRTSPLP